MSITDNSFAVLAQLAQQEADKPTKTHWDDVESDDEESDDEGKSITSTATSNPASAVSNPSLGEVVIIPGEPTPEEKKALKNKKRREKKKAKLAAEKIAAEQLVKQMAEIEEKHCTELMKAKAGASGRPYTAGSATGSDNGSAISAVDRIEQLTSDWSKGEKICFWHLTHLHNATHGSKYMGSLDTPTRPTFAMVKDINNECNGLSREHLSGWYKGKHQDGDTMIPLYANLPGVKWTGKNFAQTYGRKVSYDHTNPWGQQLYVLELWNDAPEVCRFDGRCTNKNCKNIHPHGQNLVANICRHWQQGYCSRGDTCGFDHPVQTCQPESDSASEYSTASTMSCAECNSHADGHDDPSDGQFYCNGCWGVYNKAKKTTSDSSSGKCPYDPMSAEAKDWYKKNGRV